MRGAEPVEMDGVMVEHWEVNRGDVCVWHFDMAGINAYASAP